VRGVRFEHPDRPLVVVSAVALVEGGPLSILHQAVAAARRFERANIVFLVHDAAMWDPSAGVRFHSIGWARRGYARRIAAEYGVFPALARRWRPHAWLSLHDTTPPVRCERQAVYCQNPLPYWHPTLKDLRFHPKEVARSKTYGLVFRTFARRNDHVIGQLPWYTEFIGEYMHVPRGRLIVLPPASETVDPSDAGGRAAIGARPHERLECLYVALPRVYKNFEEGIELCDAEDIRLTLTLSGDENAYARHIRQRARGRGVTFAGHLSHRDCLATIANADVVLFPSRLETFGLPIKEAIDLGSTLVLPVRPWTVAIAAEYRHAHFYRSIDEGRAILGALKRKETPTTERPTPPTNELPALASFDELYALLAGAS
jgi:hypothetical protein